MKFNKKRYRKLLKYAQKLDQHEKHLFKISESDYRELLGYSVKPSARLELEVLDRYLNLLEQFLESKISAGGLFSKYVKLQNWQDQSHEKLESNLIILSPQEEVYPVDDLLDNLYWTLEEISLESENQFFEAVIQEESFDQALMNKISKIYSPFICFHWILSNLHLFSFETFSYGAESIFHQLSTNYFVFNLYH